LLVTLIRTNITAMFQSVAKTDLAKVYEGQILLRSRRLRSALSRIPEEAFQQRKLFFNREQTGILVKKSVKPKDEDPLAALQKNPMMDPSSMMKGQAAMLFTNIYFIGMYSVIDYLYSGFVTAKLPFLLTRGWKGMFQAAIDLPNLEVSYVSSSSWYILVIFGINGISSILFGPGASMNMMQQDPVMMAASQNQQQPQMFGHDPTKVFVAEKDALALVQHRWDAEDSLKRLSRTVKKKPQ